VFDHFFLLDTHSYKLFECPLIIHRVAVHLEGFEFLQEWIKDQIDQETILDSQIKGLQSSNNITHSENMISHTATCVLLRNKSLDEGAGICLWGASELTIHLLQVLHSSLTLRDCPMYAFWNTFFNYHETLTIWPLSVNFLDLIAVHELAILLLSLGLTISTEVIGNVKKSGFYRTLVRNSLINLKDRKIYVNLLPSLGIIRLCERLNRYNPAHGVARWTHVRN
jgi:hypothetical protein